MWTCKYDVRHCNMLWYPLPAYRGDEIHSRLLSINGWMSKWCPQNNIGFIDNWTSFWGRSDLLKRDGLHPSWGDATLLSRNMAHSLRVRTWQTGAQVRKQTDWLNQPSASRLTSQKSVNSQHIETLSPRYHTRAEVLKVYIQRSESEISSTSKDPK